MKVLDRIISLLDTGMTVLAGVGLVAMVALTCANILLRQISSPIKGTFELMGLGGALVVAMALSTTQRRGENIAVDIVVALYPPAVRRLLDLASQLACMVFAIVMARQTIRLAATQWRSGEVTETLRIISYPFAFGVAAGFIVLALVFFSSLLKNVFSEKGTAP